MPSYDRSNFTPPAPVAVVTLRNLLTRAEVSDVRLLIDTGADVTLLPRDSVAEIGVNEQLMEGYELTGFDGSTSITPLVILEVLFVNRSFQGKYVLIDEPVGILGRDVLNQVRLVLDGPNQQWSDLAP